MKRYQAADARYAVARTIIAHAVRAILLASATAMTMGRLARAFMPTIHGIAFTALDRVSAVSAPVTSNRRGIVKLASAGLPWRAAAGIRPV